MFSNRILLRLKCVLSAQPGSCARNCAWPNRAVGFRGNVFAAQRVRGGSQGVGGGVAGGEREEERPKSSRSEGKGGPRRCSRPQRRGEWDRSQVPRPGQGPLARRPASPRPRRPSPAARRESPVGSPAARDARGGGLSYERPSGAGRARARAGSLGEGLIWARAERGTRRRATGHHGVCGAARDGERAGGAARVNPNLLGKGAGVRKQGRGRAGRGRAWVLHTPKRT